MKRIIQFTLLGIIIMSIFLFNKLYFSSEKKITIESDIPNNETTLNNETTKETESNIIKNLKYEVKLEEDNWYIITSKTSELTYIDNVERVKMQEVIAKFIGESGLPLVIISDEAIYDNSNFNTNFRNNIEIKYMDNKIFSDKVDINFQNNTIKIFENVRYVGEEGTINSDNIMINLITKKVNIYMDKEIDKVNITKN